MTKKIVIIILCTISLSIAAQDCKFGHVNTVEILSQMPEKATIEKTISDLSSQWNS